MLAAMCARDFRCPRAAFTCAAMDTVLWFDGSL